MYRRLGLGEHLVWLYDQDSPCHFILTAQIMGEFSTNQLQQALPQVQQRHPLLRVYSELDMSPEQMELLQKVAMQKLGL